jgi:hypothetical protein
MTLEFLAQQQERIINEQANRVWPLRVAAADRRRVAALIRPR